MRAADLTPSTAAATARAPKLTWSVPFVSVPPAVLCDWNAWTEIGDGAAVQVDQFHAGSSPHNRPRVSAILAYNDDSIYAIFRVIGERHVQARQNRHQSSVWEDSCVELFLQPREGMGGYFNFEINCMGTILCHWIEDPGPPTNPDELFAQSTPLTAQQLELVQVASSLASNEPGSRNLRHGDDWIVGLRVPLDVLRCHAIVPWKLSGTTMGANLFKCADASPEPHWASWSPIGSNLSFHQPTRFGRLVFR